jgi:ATP-binding cassette subfamily F protein uup
VGGYSDWLRQRRASAVHAAAGAARGAPTRAGGDPAAARAVGAASHGGKGAALTPGAAAARPRKLSYKDQRELEAMPATISRLEAEQTALQAAVGDPALFRRSPEDAAAAVQRLQTVTQELEAAFARWETLEAATARG